MDDTRASREPDDTVPIPAITDAVAGAIADADDGPPCGEPAAITDIWVSYVYDGGDGMVHISHNTWCCARHIPADVLAIPDRTELMEVIIQDGLVQTTVLADGTSTVLVNLRFEAGQVSTFPPTWPCGKGVLELGDFAEIT